jgi:hypothetical protein
MRQVSFPILRSRGVAVGVVLASLAACGCERAAERQGADSGEWREFAGSWNAAGTRRTIPLGADRSGSIVNLRGTMLLAGAGRPGVGFRAEVIAMSDTGSGLVGRSVWTDEQGDQVFSELRGEGTRERNHIEGTIIGGTGRYVGASGTYEFAWQFMIETEDGAIQGRATGLKGRYRMEPPRLEGGA